MAAAIRPRGPAESFDLGFRMVRQWWGPVYGAWLLAVLPVYAAAAALPGRWLGYTLLGLWWLRPLFDRVPLFVLSRCLFGAPAGWRETLRALPGLWGRQLAGALTWRRCDPWRSLHLPARQLEHVRGRERRARLRLLGSGCRRQALGLTLGCLLLELGALIGLFGLVHMFLPDPERVWKAIFEASSLDSVWIRLLWLAIFFVAFSVVEPFYVGAGFALYLGQRTRFEGWDVEIALRRLAARLAAAPGAVVPGGGPVGAEPATMPAGEGRTAAPAGAGHATVPAGAGHATVPALLLALGVALAAPAPSPAASLAAASSTLGGQARKAVDEVLRAPDFETLDQEVHWVPRSPGARAVADSEWTWLPPVRVPPMPRRAKLGLAAAAGVGALAWGLRRWRRVWHPAAWRGGGAGPDAAGAGAPLTVHGLDVRPASLPADVPAAAWQLWERGEAAAALSLLYRGALAALMATTAIRFAESWTEGDCLLAVRRHVAAGAGSVGSGGSAGGGGDAGAAGGGDSASAELFARLTATWQAAAYARRVPDGPLMRDLCAGWRRSYGGAVLAAPAGGRRGAATSEEYRDWRRSEPRP